MERWGNKKAIFMHKVTNGEYLENISSLFVVKNNDNIIIYEIIISISNYKSPKQTLKKKASAIQV
jgi:hypothetical protein